MYVCMFLCMYVCMYVCIYVYMHIVLDIFKLNVRNGKNKLFLPTSHLFANLVARNAVQKQVLNPTRDTEDTKERHHCYQ